MHLRVARECLLRIQVKVYETLFVWAAARISHGKPIMHSMGMRVRCTRDDLDLVYNLGRVFFNRTISRLRGKLTFATYVLWKDDTSKYAVLAE